MLSMLTIIQDKRRGLFSSIRKKLLYPPVNGVILKTGNTPYLQITAGTGEKGIDWRMVAAYCLDPAGRLLLPMNVQCPHDFGLRGFVPTTFRRRLMESLLIDVLACMSTPPSKRTLAIYGRENEIAALLPRIAPLVGEVRIITRRDEAIRDAAESLIREYGMPVTLTQELNACGCSLLLAADGGAGMLETDSGCVVLSPTRPMRRDALWISSARACLPAELEDIYMPEYDINEFVGAFFELGGRFEFGSRSPACGVCGGSAISISDIAKAADSRAQSI